MVLFALIGGELASLAFPSIDAILRGGGEVVLLATALLLVFRMIVRHLERTTAPLSRVSFGAGVEGVTKRCRATSNLYVFANDGTKYYQFINEQEFQVRTIRVLLCDIREAEKWLRLAEKGRVGQIAVRRYDGRPVIHVCGSSDGAAMFGAFANTGTNRPSPGQTYLVEPDNMEARELAKSIAELFETAWASGQDVLSA